MSEMRTVCAIRMKLGQYEDYNELYESLRDKVTVEDIEYECYWDEDTRDLVETNIVEYFEIKEGQLIDDDTGCFYVDKRLIDVDCEGDFELSLSENKIREVSEELRRTFGIDGETRLVMYNWYTGCNEPAIF